MREEWKWETGNRCSVSVFFAHVGSQISPRRAKKDSNIPFPGRTRSVKCPTPGPTKTIKSPPHALPPPHPSTGFTVMYLSMVCPRMGGGGNPQEIPFLGASFIAALSVSRKKQLLGDKIMVPTNFVHRPKCRRHVLAEHLVWLEI